MQSLVDKFTDNELLDLLVEECAEVIKAAQKCKRFGMTREYRDYGRNDIVLAAELGDVHAMVHAIIEKNPMMRPAEQNARTSKLQRALAAKTEYELQLSLSRPSAIVRA